MEQVEQILGGGTSVKINVPEGSDIFDVPQHLKLMASDTLAAVGKSLLEIDWHYSGKPSGTYTIGTAYSDLDVPAYRAPFNGVGFFAVYANLNKPPTDAKVRVRLARKKFGAKEQDETGYQDFDIEGGGTKTNRLISHMYFLQLEAGRDYAWQFDATKDITVETRYFKVVSLNFATLIVNNLGSPQLIPDETEPEPSNMTLPIIP